MLKYTFDSHSAAVLYITYRKTKKKSTTFSSFIFIRNIFLIELIEKKKKMGKIPPETHDQTQIEMSN